MNQDQKLDIILSTVAVIKTDVATMKKELETNGRDIQELRSDVWGKNGIKTKTEAHEIHLATHEETLEQLVLMKPEVESHSFHIGVGKWFGAIVAGAALLALINSILHLIVK